MNLDGGLRYCFYFVPPKWVKIPILTHFFHMGWVQPPTRESPKMRARDFSDSSAPPEVDPFPTPSSWKISIFSSPFFVHLKKKPGGQICHIKRMISDQPNCWLNLFSDFLRVLSIGTSGLQIGCNFPRAQSTRGRFDNIAREWRCKWSADNDKVDRQNQWIL